jgi:predicted ester cyclase
LYGEVGILAEKGNERVIAKIVEQANLRNIKRMMECFADDVVAQWHRGEKWDKKGVHDMFEGSWDIWSEGIYRIDRVISKGDTVVAEVHWSGVHTGDWVSHGIPATGKRVELVEVWIVDFGDGKVKVYNVFYNPEMVVKQLRE